MNDMKTMTRRGILGAVVASAGIIALSPSALADTPAKVATDLLNLINRDRVAKGYQKLTVRSNLATISQERANAMAKKGTLDSSLNYGDSRLGDWEGGLALAFSTYYDNASSLYNQMKGSSAYTDLMRPHFNSVGISGAKSSGGELFFSALPFEYKSAAPAPKPKQTFTDVNSKTIFSKEIEALAAMGILQGWKMKNGTRQYRPLANVQRDAVIAFIYRAMGSPKFTAPKKSPFTDVSTKHVFYKEIAWAYSEGITEGWKMRNGTRQFRPNANIKRDAMAAFLMRASGDKAPKVAQSFRDVKSTQPHSAAMTWMKNTGISTGWIHKSGLPTYQPFSNTKRDAMAAFLYRWMKYTNRL